VVWPGTSTPRLFLCLLGFREDPFSVAREYGARSAAATPLIPVLAYEGLTSSSSALASSSSALACSTLRWCS
jgi:hypothetical protein